MPAKSAKLRVEVEVDASDARSDAKKVESALKDIEDAANAVGDATSGIEELTQATKDLADATGEAGQSSGGLGDAFKSGAIAGGAAGAVMVAADVIKAGFQKLGELASEAFASALDMQASRGKLKAQLGLTVEQSATFGRLAGEIYAQNYGDSLDEVNEAIRFVAQNIDGTMNDPALLQGVTTGVIDLSKAFDQDLGGVTRAVGQMMKTGLADNAQEALDILTRGFQVGNDKAEDLLDTMNEYGTSFRVVGVNGEQAMGLIRQGLEGGARDADQVADAIKEFGIRAQDGSKTTSDAFKALGLDAEKMAGQIAGGGPKAAEGLDTVLDRLRGISDPLERTRIATGLFGTQSEDMAKALNGLDLTTAEETLGGFAGSAEQMGTDLNTNTKSTFDTWKRTIETSVVTTITESVLPAIDDLIKKGTELWDQFKNSKFLEDVKKTLDDLGKTVLPVLTGAWNALLGVLTPLWDNIRNNEELLHTLKILFFTIAGIIGFWMAQTLAFVAVMVLLAVGVVNAIGVIIRAVAQFAGFVKDNAWHVLEFFGAIADVIENAIQVIWDVIQNVFTAIKDFILGVLKFLIEGWNHYVATLVGLLQMIWNTVVSVWSAVLGFVSNVIGTLARVGAGIWNFVTEGLSNVWNTVTSTFDRVVGFITGLPGRIADAARGMWDGITNAFKSAINGVIDMWNGIKFEIGPFGLDTPDIPHLATGGIVNRPTLALIGERGPEAVVPLNRMATVGGGTVINVTINHSGLGIDSPKLQREIVGALQRWSDREGPIRVPIAG